MDFDTFLDVFRTEDQLQARYENWGRANAYLARRWEEIYKLPPVLDNVVDANKGVTELQANLKDLVEKANCHFDFSVPNISVTLVTNGEKTYRELEGRDFTAIPWKSPKADLKKRIQLEQKYPAPVYGPLRVEMLRSTLNHYFT